MALDLHDWWTSDPQERFWIEVTGRKDLGADLKAPQTNESSKPFWGYSLINHVQAGDVIFHYDRGAEEQAIVAVSVATGDHWEDSIMWAARGSYARNAGIEPHIRPGYYAGLERFRSITKPVTLNDIRDKTGSIQRGLRKLEAQYKKPLYFPFESGKSRPTRPLQGYLFKLPRFFVELFDELGSAYGESLVPSENKSRVGSEYRRPDEETTIGSMDPFTVDPAVVERGTRAHAATQNVLADSLLVNGIEPLSPGAGDPNFDLAWRQNGELWVAEVKSLTDENEEKQLRLGLGQLLRYQHLLQMKEERIVHALLFVERQPSEPSWEKLCHGLGIQLAWPSYPDGLGADLFSGVKLTY